MLAPITIKHAIRMQMRFLDQTGAILTDSHFLIPVVVFCIGLALLVMLH